MGFRLEAVEFVDLAQWRWVLSDDSGTILASHEVRLDGTSWQFEAFADLVGYLSWRVAPDRRARDEERIVAELGEWIGSHVLGSVADVLVSSRPAVVPVVVPAQAADLLDRPIELAHINGRPLAVQDVTLVMQPRHAGKPLGMPPDMPAGRVRASAARDRLRVLGLFSLPEGGRSLNLRRERRSLVMLIDEIAAAGKAASVRVLQYGVTRELLAGVLADAEGWDIVHISGHGAPGELLLETADGRPDRVTATELSAVLAAARGRLKLVTVSACWSAATTAARQRQLLGLPLPQEPPADPAERPPGPRAPEAPSGTLAAELSSRLGCAVLAMRYPVGDEFAIAMADRLYTLIAGDGEALARAVAMTLRELADRPADTSFTTLALVTPVMFGESAVGLRLAAPDDTTPVKDPGAPKLPGFPPEPGRFAGRTGVMARASAALAPASGIPGVLLAGMPGGGKTACALELAYGHEHAFDQLIWFKAPDEGMAIEGALTDFALTLERYLPGLQMLDVLSSAGRLAAFLPELTMLMGQRRLLIVIDNAESLLAEDGSWDQQWAGVIGALLGHSGPGRLILTSRRVPAGLTTLRAEAVDTLSPDEALLLAGELPHLDALIRGKVRGMERYRARQLARRVLEVTRGHPKLLELAEGQAAHPDHLAELVRAGDQAWRDQATVPEGFFAATGPASPAGDFWQVLATWTRAVAGTLEPGERDLFWFLCCLEEPDRERLVLSSGWEGLWSRLGRDREPPGLDEPLAVLAAHGLAAIRLESPGGSESYKVHPAVAAAGRAHAGQEYRDAVDAAAAACWGSVLQQAAGNAGNETTDTVLAVRAALAGVPYLVRQHEWTVAAGLLERAFIQDPSRATAAAALPVLRQISMRDPYCVIVLATVLEALDPVAAEATLRAYLDAAVADGDYRAAAVAAFRLAYICSDGGRLAEALALARRQSSYARRANLGPWDRLASKSLRLQVLNAMGGHPRIIFAQARQLLRRMDTLPAPGPDQVTPAWSVREKLLEEGFDAALQLGRWQDALDLNAAVIASKRDRRAPATDIARSRYNDHRSLLQLGRTAEAIELLRDCRKAFEEARDIGALGKVLSALADAEEDLGHRETAIAMEHDALRYRYLAGDVTGIAVSYHNLGEYIRRHTGRAELALPPHLAADLICVLAQARGVGELFTSAARDLRHLGPGAVPPADIADLCARLSGIPGTDLPDLIGKLSSRPEAAEQALRNVISRAQALAPAPARPQRKRWGARAGRGGNSA